MGNIVNTSTTTWGFPFLSPNGNKPANYLYQIALDHEIPPGMLFHDCLVSIADAHKKHPSGNVYACYGTWIGRGIVWLIYPMESPNDIKKILNDEEVLCHALGKEAGKKRIEEYKSTLISNDSALLKYVPEYSHPSTKKEETPMEYIFYRTIDFSKQHNKKEFTQAIQTIIAAYNQHPETVNWVTYKEEHADRFHVFVPMRRFGAMDNWPDVKQVLSQTKDQKQAQAREVYYANITNQKTQIMTYVPSCDNSGCEFVE